MAINNEKRACGAKIRLLTARISTNRQKIMVLMRQSVRIILLAQDLSSEQKNKYYENWSNQCANGKYFPNH